jgi:hypothetical protein
MNPRHAAALALVGSIGSLLLSCGIVRVERSAEDLSSSKTAYEQCLRASESVNQCSKEKAIYDADLAEYEARHKAVSRYGASSVTVNNRP